MERIWGFAEEKEGERRQDRAGGLVRIGEQPLDGAWSGGGGGGECCCAV